MTQLFAVTQVLLSAGLITLVLMHSGRDTGFGGLGFTPSSQGGTHIVERNLTRLTTHAANHIHQETQLGAHRRASPPADRSCPRSIGGWAARRGGRWTGDSR